MIKMECLNCGYKWEQENFTGGSILWGDSILFADNVCPQCRYSLCYPEEERQKAIEGKREVEREIEYLASLL